MILLWLVLLLNLVVVFLTLFQSKLQNWNGWLWTTTTDDSIRHVWNFLWLGYRQVGFWYRCTWFGFWGPSWFNRIKRNSVGPGNMSHCGTPSLDNHLNHCFVVLKHMHQSFLMRKLDVWGNTINVTQHVGRSLRSFVCTLHFVIVDNGSPRSFRSLSHASKGKQSDPINREQESRLISIQRPKRWFQILLKCVKLKFVSYTSNLLEQMYDFQKCTMFLQKWISNLQDLPQNRSLETVPVCIVLHHITILFVFTCVMNTWYQSIQAFDTGFGRFVIDLANLFTDHRISGLPIRAKYKHFRTIWEHTCHNSPTDFISSALKWWSSMQGADTL